MSSEIGIIKTFIAAAEIKARRLVKMTSAAGKVQTGDSNTVNVVGVSTEIGALQGNPIDIALSGISEAETGGIFAVGSLLTSDSEGRAIIASPSGNTATRIVGLALEASTAAGELRRILIAQSALKA